MKYTYLAVFAADQQNGGYTVMLPDFQGAISEASTEREALYQARELLEIYIMMMEDEGEAVPKASSFKTLASCLESDEDIIQALSIDSDVVRARERAKVVNKTVTLPSWLVQLGKEHKINFSQLLQKALREELQV